MLPRAEKGLIVAFLALGTADILNGNAIHLAGFQVLMKSFVNAVELVAVAGGIGEIDLGRPMAVDTPAHAQRSELLHLVHFLDRSMAGLTLYLAGLRMLGMAKEDVVGEIVDLDPFHGFRFGRIVGAGLGIIAGVAVQLLDLGCAIHFGVVLAV